MVNIIKRIVGVTLIIFAIALTSVISTLLTATYLKLDHQGLIPSAFSLGGEHAIRGPENGTANGKKPEPWKPRGNDREYEI